MTSLIGRFIADEAVGVDALAAAVAGNGISGGAGSALAVASDSTGGANLATIVNVSANGVAVRIDDATITENGSNQLAVGADSIGATQLDETDDYTFSGTLTATSATLSVATPTQAAHAATKAYADALRNGIRHKDNCLAAAVANVAITGVPSPIDGVTLGADDRVLLTNQTTDSQNGIWIISAGAWARPDDFDTGASAAGSQVWVDQGTTYQDTMWECTTNEGSDVIDTNDLAFTQRPVGETVTGGTGLTKSGTVLHVGSGATGNVSGINRTADDIAAAVDTTTIEISSNLLQVVDLGVTTAKLAATSVTAAKLGSDVAGVGLGGGNGSAIDVDIVNTTAEATAANGDELLIHSVAQGGVRAMTRANFLAGVGTGETRGQEAHVITSGEVTNGYFTLAQSPSTVGTVTAFVIGGIPQVNKQLSPTATPDFDVLSSNQLHFNNNGAATGLTQVMIEGDEVVVEYSY